MASVQHLLGSIRTVLRDADGDSWRDSEIVDAILEGELVVAIHRPGAVTEEEIDFTCQAGSFQSLDSIQSHTVAGLLSVVCNGTKAEKGAAVNVGSREDLDILEPGWHTANPGKGVSEYMYTEVQPEVFYVYPPAAADHKLVLSVRAVPKSYGPVTSSTQTTVNDKYAPAVREWALYRLFSNDMEGSANFHRAGRHHANCANLLGVQLQNEYRVSPKNPESRK